LLNSEIKKEVNGAAEIEQEVQPRETILQHHESIAPNISQERISTNGKRDEIREARSRIPELGSLCGDAVLSVSRRAVLERDNRRSVQLPRSAGAAGDEGAEAFHIGLCQQASVLGVISECVLQHIEPMPSGDRK